MDAALTTPTTVMFQPPQPPPRASASKSWRQLKDFAVGEIVDGRVRRVEKFGVFVEIPGSSVVGLAHISELVDEKVRS